MIPGVFCPAYDWESLLKRSVSVCQMDNSFALFFMAHFPDLVEFITALSFQKVS